MAQRTGAGAGPGNSLVGLIGYLRVRWKKNSPLQCEPVMSLATALREGSVLPLDNQDVYVEVWTEKDALAGYLVLLWQSASAGADVGSPHHHVLALVILAVLGGVVSYQVRRFQLLHRYFERPLTEPKHSLS